MDEHGNEVPPGLVWTGTTSAGLAGSDCRSWQTDAFSDEGTMGDVGDTTSGR